jgi:hypothetical protein
MAVGLVFVPPGLEHDGLAFDITQPTETVSERVEGRQGRPARRQDTDPRNLPRWLRSGGERRGEETAGQAANERSPVHYSIT